MRSITRIDIVGDKMIVHEKREISLDFIDLKAKGLDCVPYAWLLKQGYTKILLTGHGFGYARTRDGLWDKIDIQNEHVEYMDQVSSQIPDMFFQDTAVPQDEWGPWARKIPVHRRNTDL